MNIKHALFYSSFHHRHHLHNNIFEIIHKTGFAFSLLFFVYIVGVLLFPLFRLVNSVDSVFLCFWMFLSLWLSLARVCVCWFWVIQIGNIAGSHYEMPNTECPCPGCCSIIIIIVCFRFQWYYFHFVVKKIQNTLLSNQCGTVKLYILFGLLAFAICTYFMWCITATLFHIWFIRFCCFSFVIIINV